MERKFTFSGEDQDLLSGFRLVLVETFRPDLDSNQRGYVDDALNEIARNCVNRGMGLELVKIKEDVVMEQKLMQLKRAWNDGEIEL